MTALSGDVSVSRQKLKNGSDRGSPSAVEAKVRLTAPERNDLLELLDSTLITSQLPVKAWHTYLDDPTLADAILDRIVHSSHKIELKSSKSLRDSKTDK